MSDVDDATRYHREEEGQRVDGYTEEEHAALAQMADALARFALAMEACSAAGLTLPAALTACGVPLPAWAVPMVGTLTAPAPGG